jgi:photosystem II stability/assembly factor-like uncharacterized protein
VRIACSIVAIVSALLAGCGGSGDCPALSVDMQSLAAQASTIELDVFDASATCDGNDVAAGAPAPLVSRTLSGHDGTMLQLLAGHYIIVMHAFDAAGAFIGSACDAEVFTPGQHACVSVALSTPMIDGDGGIPDLAGGGGAGGGGGGAGGGGGGSGGVFVPQSSGVTTALYQPWSPGGGVAYIVGVSGVILKTTDAGTTWTKQTSGTQWDLEGVWGTTATDVWVAGKKGTLLHTTNGGTTWTPFALGVSGDLYDVWGSSASDMYIVGAAGVVKHGNGTTFSTVNVSAGMTVINSVWGSSGSDVYLFGGNGLIMRGAAAGGFSKTFSPTGDFLFFGWGTRDGNDVWVPSINQSTGASSLWHSSDHGASWQSQHDSASPLGAVWVSDSNDAFVAGDQLLESTDRGATWNLAGSTGQSLFGVGGDAAGTAVWAAGAGGTILYRP